MTGATLKQAITPIVDSEYEKLIGKRKAIAMSTWKLNVETRLKDEVNLNDHVAEIASKACESAAHSKTGEYPALEEMLLPGFADAELKSKGFRFEKDHFVTLYDANYEQIMFRYFNQQEHAEACVQSVAKTRLILQSEIGKLMKEDPTLSFGKAKKLWLKNPTE